MLTWFWLKIYGGTLGCSAKHATRFLLVMSFGTWVYLSATYKCFRRLVAAWTRTTKSSGYLISVVTKLWELRCPDNEDNPLSPPVGIWDGKEICPVEELCAPKKMKLCPWDTLSSLDGLRLWPVDMLVPRCLKSNSGRCQLCIVCMNVSPNVCDQLFISRTQGYSLSEMRTKEH